MSYKSKYAVPFLSKNTSTTGNSVSSVIDGGIGYLIITLPSNPLINSSIGFKLKVTSEDTKEMLFNGYLSGSVSDGYKWIYAFYENLSNEDNHIKGPVLFCYKYRDDETIIKSILLGEKDTNWGSKVSINVEMIQASDVTSSINEYGNSTYNSSMDGWKFNISQMNDNIVSLEINNINRESSGSKISYITIDGVVVGSSEIDESGNITITTSFNGNSINLYNESTDEYGKIIADGSELIGLKDNEEIKNLEVESTGFKDSVVITSSDDSDVKLNLKIKNSGESITTKLEVNRLNLGLWSSDNSNKFMSVKYSSDVGVNSPVNTVPLRIGELGFINNNLNSDLYIGNGSNNILVGGAKVCSNSREFESIDKIDGKLIVFEGKLYVCNKGKYELIKFSDNISMDEIRDGYFYERVSADAVLGGEITRLKCDDDYLLQSNDIRNHMNDSYIHISQKDKDNWNSKYGSNDTYNKSEIDDRISKLSKSNHYHGYHSPVNLVLDGEFDLSVHAYPYGHRILIREYNGNPPFIKISGGVNTWLEDEEFGLGHKVVGAFGVYPEFMNKNNVVVEL